MQCARVLWINVNKKRVHLCSAVFKCVTDIWDCSRKRKCCSYSWHWL